MRKQRIKSPKLTTGTRKEIAELYAKGMKRKEIADYLKCSIYQVDAVIYKKVKMKKADRADKGKSRKKVVGDKVPDSKADNKTMVQRLEVLLEAAVIDLESRQYKPDEKISLIERAARLLKNLKGLELQNHMKGLDAQVYIRTLLRFDPDLTIDQIKKIYLEEVEKLRNNLE